MATCCGSSGRCTCRVTAGPGVTVDGSGAPGAPYVISASGSPTALTAVDSPNVDVEVTGTGSPSDPYAVTADVILDPAPPAGGTNLIQTGPDGLFVECADVRGCLAAGDGIDYDPATGVIEAQISGDAGNTTVIGGDGGLFTPAAAPAGLGVTDSRSVDLELTGTGAPGDPYAVTADVILDPAPPAGGTNLIQTGPDGLFVECADVRGCLAAGDGIDYDPATGVIEAQISGDAGNTTVIGGDGGLFTPAAAPAGLGVTDTSSVDLTLTGTGAPGDLYALTADVILDPAPPGGGTNLIQDGPDGLFLECEQVRGCVSAGDGAAYDPTTGVIRARISTDAGNTVAIGTDGGLVGAPSAALEVGCGLQGEGTVSSPLAAFPIAGQRSWATDWTCAAATNSTLRCDPITGALWTPPEHSSAAVTIQQNHPMGTPVLAPTSGYIVINNTVFSEGTYTADSLSACRGMSFQTQFDGHVEVTWTAGSTFNLGYAIQIDGGALAVRVGHSRLQAGGIAGHERFSFGVSQSAVLPPHTGYTVRVFPAAFVVAGSVTINQWITDTQLLIVTR